ncbi:MAG: RNA polymerase sigma factor [Bacteroidota bacterium]
MLTEQNYTPSQDLELIEKIKSGNKKALENLVQHHYAYIYNIALKFFNNVLDAEDAAQEVVIKMITKLDSYDASKAKLRTWLYRIVFHHFLNAKRVGHEILLKDGFDTFADLLDNVPAQSLSEKQEKEIQSLIEESKVACMAGMLMCLNRPQRLTYIIGEIFEVDHNLAAKIFEISPASFRKRLSRVRKELYNWMNNKCGLVNKSNSCRCP